MLNPTLSDLIGGVQTVTLSDEEARRRGTQKSILERKAPPTFDVIVEIQTREKVAVHENVSDVVDAILRGTPVTPEVRWLDESGQVHRERGAARAPEAPPYPRPVDTERDFERRSRKLQTFSGKRRPRIYLFGLSERRLDNAVRDLGLEVDITRDLNKADAVIATKAYHRRRRSALRDAEDARVPIFVLRDNTSMQLQRCLATIAGVETRSDAVDTAMEEAQAAIDQVLSSAIAVELAPQDAYVRRLQHQLAERYGLQSKSEGDEPHRRVTFLP
jgi:hypothetical protein